MTDSKLPNVGDYIVFVDDEGMFPINRMKIGRSYEVIDVDPNRYDYGGVLVQVVGDQCWLRIERFSWFHE